MQEVTAHGSIGSIGSIGSGSMVRRDQSDFQTRINVTCSIEAEKTGGPGRHREDGKLKGQR